MKSKKDLINTVAEATDFSKATVETVVNAFLKEIIDSLTAKEPVRIYELGTFKISHRGEHKGHNPVTGKDIVVPARALPQLKFNQTITRVMNSEG